MILFRGLLCSRPVFGSFWHIFPNAGGTSLQVPARKIPVLPQKHKAQSKPRSLKRGIRSNFGKCQDAFPQCWHVIYTTWIHMKHSQSIQRKVNTSRFFAVIFTWQGREVQKLTHSSSKMYLADAPPVGAKKTNYQGPMTTLKLRYPLWYCVCLSWVN